MTLSRPASRWYALLLAAAPTLALNPRVSADPGWQLSFAAVAGILALGRRLGAALAQAGGGAASRSRRRRRTRSRRHRLTCARACPRLRRRRRDHVCSHACDRSARGVPLRCRAPRRTRREPACATRRGARHVARDGQGRAGDRRRRAPARTARSPSCSGRSPGSARLPRAASRSAARQAGGRLALPLHSAGCRWRFVLRRAVAAVRLAAGSAGAAGGRSPRPGYAERAAAWRRAPRAFRVAVLVLVLTVLALATATGLGSPSPPGDLTVRFLDIGQGDATLIQDGHGANALFDAGPPEGGGLPPAPRGGRQAARPRRLHAAVARPPGRLHELIGRMPIGLLLTNGYGTRDADYHQLLREADAAGIRPRRALARRGPPRRTDDGPDPRPATAPARRASAGGPEPARDRRDRQLQGAFDLWLSADAESDAILRYPLRRVEAMKVSHHGSADPGLPEVLDRLRPRDRRRSRWERTTHTATRRPRRLRPWTTPASRPTAPTRTAP